MAGKTVNVNVAKGFSVAIRAERISEFRRNNRVIAEGKWGPWEEGEARPGLVRLRALAEKLEGAKSRVFGSLDQIERTAKMEMEAAAKAGKKAWKAKSEFEGNTRRVCGSLQELAENQVKISRLRVKLAGIGKKFDEISGECLIMGKRKDSVFETAGFAEYAMRERDYIGLTLYNIGIISDRMVERADGRHAGPATNFVYLEGKEAEGKGNENGSRGNGELEGAKSLPEFLAGRAKAGNGILEDEFGQAKLRGIKLAGKALGEIELLLDNIAKEKMPDRIRSELLEIADAIEGGLSGKLVNEIFKDNLEVDNREFKMEIDGANSVFNKIEERLERELDFKMRKSDRAKLEMLRGAKEAEEFTAIVFGIGKLSKEAQKLMKEHIALERARFAQLLAISRGVQAAEGLEDAMHKALLEESQAEKKACGAKAAYEYAKERVARLYGMEGRVGALELAKAKIATLTHGEETRKARQKRNGIKRPEDERQAGSESRTMAVEKTRWAGQGNWKRTPEDAGEKTASPINISPNAQEHLDLMGKRKAAMYLERITKIPQYDKHHFYDIKNGNTANIARAQIFGAGRIVYELKGGNITVLGCFLPEEHDSEYGRGWKEALGIKD